MELQKKYMIGVEVTLEVWAGSGKVSFCTI